MPSFPGLLAGPRPHRPPAVQLSGLCLGRWGLRTAGAGGAEHRGGGEGPWACRGSHRVALTSWGHPAVGSAPGEEGSVPGEEGFSFPACEGRGRALSWAHRRGTCWWPSLLERSRTGDRAAAFSLNPGPISGFLFSLLGCDDPATFTLRGLLGLTRLGQGPGLCSYNTLFSPLSSYSRWNW